MNNILIGATAVALVTAAFALGRCSSAPPAQNLTAENDATVTEGVNLVPEQSPTWTCAMHPQIQQHEPGQCPICGMDLILAQQDEPLEEAHAAHSNALSLSQSARALADIQTSRVERRYPEAEVRLVGKLDYDETLVKSLSARFPMRIEELFVSFVGVPVKKGQHLARIYSPELRSAQSELLSAIRYDSSYDNKGVLVKSAKEKLRLWGLMPEQIDAIVQRGVAQDEFELKAPISGIVTRKNINTGDYINTGDSLFTIVDMHNLWLKLEAYESDLAWLRLGQPISFTVEAYPGETFDGKITFINPEINRTTRTVSIRVNVANEHKKLKPGMFSKAIVRSKIALAGKVYSPDLIGKWISPMHPEIIKDKPGQCDICGMDLVPVEQLGYLAELDHSAPLVVPASAVLRTGKRAVVYVQTNGTDDKTLARFEGREINLGPRAGEVFIVNSGLQEHDLVVTNGAFKIDSALQIRAKPSMMNPPASNKESSPSNAHDSHDHDHDHGHQSAQLHGAAAHAQPEPALDATALTEPFIQQIMPHYFALQNALAGDELAQAKQHITAMASLSTQAPALEQLLSTMASANSLDNIRLPHFEVLSNYLMQGVNHHSHAFESAIYQMYCPMAHPDRGANWLQDSPKLQNPYFGDAMLQCGETKAQLTSGKATKRSSEHRHEK
ncbi:MAG TPA: efflux RND transporter periplasmic adaptor subunit [Marinagarivorans sp.]